MVMFTKPHLSEALMHDVDVLPGGVQDSPHNLILRDAVFITSLAGVDGVHILRVRVCRTTRFAPATTLVLVVSPALCAIPGIFANTRGCVRQH